MKEVFIYSKEINRLIWERLRKFLDTGKIPKEDEILKWSYESIGLQKEDLPLFFLEELKEWFDRVLHQVFLKEVFDEFPHFTEIIIHSPHEVQIQTSQKRILYQFKMTEEELKTSFEICALQHNLNWNFSFPVQSFAHSFFEHECRLTLVHKSLLSKGQFLINIRKHTNREQTQKLNFSVSSKHEFLIETLVRQKKNLLIAGSTGSGKTTFLRQLFPYFHPEEHVIVMEDTHEVLSDRPQTTFLRHRPGDPKSELKEICRHALRLSPDRLILGEMRGEEAISLMLAANTGHRGIISTIHANSASEALDRIALLFQLYFPKNHLTEEGLMRLICKNIDYVIFLENKKLKEIIEIKGPNKGSPLYLLK